LYHWTDITVDEQSVESVTFAAMSSVTLASYMSKIQPREIEKAFDIEKVTKEFLRRYKGLYDNVRDELDKNTADFKRAGLEIDDFAKKLLGQIVFLYFLQKKGWFGVKRGNNWGTGDKNYLRHLFQQRETYYRPGDKGNFFNDILEPLFYNTLAIKRTDDWSDRFSCKIPFLKGGLFEPLFAHDWVNTKLLLPDTLFSNSDRTKEGGVGTGILDVFDRYDFTVNEAEPLEKQVAVDPEMLGKAFESLMASRERKNTGAFYTPQDLVEQLTTSAIASGIRVDAIESALTGEIPPPEDRRQLLAHIGQLRILDPACGSGAFLVHCLERLATLRIHLGDVRPLHDVRREILTRSIFGVDVNPTAVWLCELRLWLSTAIQDPERDPMRVIPLPNLDRNIRIGGSLTGGSFHSDSRIPKPARIARVRAQYTRAIGPRKISLARKLDKLE